MNDDNGNDRPTPPEPADSPDGWVPTIDRPWRPPREHPSSGPIRGYPKAARPVPVRECNSVCYSRGAD